MEHNLHHAVWFVARVLLSFPLFTSLPSFLSLLLPFLDPPWLDLYDPLSAPFNPHVNIIPTFLLDNEFKSWG
jgi:hypothetical protein